MLSDWRRRSPAIRAARKKRPEEIDLESTSGARLCERFYTNTRPCPCGQRLCGSPDSRQRGMGMNDKLRPRYRGRRTLSDRNGRAELSKISWLPQRLIEPVQQAESRCSKPLNHRKQSKVHRTLIPSVLVRSFNLNERKRAFQNLFVGCFRIAFCHQCGALDREF